MNEGEEAQVAQRLAVQQAVARVLLESQSLDEAMSEVLRLVATHLGWSLAVYWVADDGVGVKPTLRCRAVWADPSVLRAPVVEATRTTALRPGEEAPGQAMGAREPVWVEALADEPEASPRLALAFEAGLRSVAAFPLREREAVPAVVELFGRDRRRPADDGTLNLMTAVGHQVALVRHRAEAQTAALEELERTRDDLAKVLRVLPDVVTVRDGAGRVVYANEPPPGDAGTPVAELRRMALMDLPDRFQMWDQDGQPLGPDDLPGARAARGEIEDRVVRVRRIGSPDDERWLAIRAAPVVGPGRLAVTVLRDVTAEQRRREWARLAAQAEDALLAATEPAAALRDLAALACRSIAGRCAAVLRHAGGDLRLAAFSRAACGAGSPDDGAAHADPLRLSAAALDAGRGILLHDGPASTIAVPLAARGEPRGALVLEVGRDGRRYGPADLEAAEELARRTALGLENLHLRAAGQDATRSREDLLAIVSHDLRNPLGVVMASSALLLKSPLTDPPGKEGRSRRQVEAIQRAGTRMNRLIRDLLDFAAIQAGRLTVSTHPRGAGELVREAFAALAPQAAAKSLKLIDGSPESTLGVSCDHDRAIQIFDNVIGNAVKFSNEGGSITVAAEPDGGMVRFSVTDEGPGIPPEELPHVFDRAYQARRRNREGIGLGLSIAKGIVEAHGGRIWVESPAAATGAGTRLFFTLPAAEG
jgi:signal transduction histidine kinase